MLDGDMSHLNTGQRLLLLRRRRLAFRSANWMISRTVRFLDGCNEDTRYDFDAGVFIRTRSGPKGPQSSNEDAGDDAGNGAGGASVSEGQEVVDADTSNELPCQ